MNSNRFYFLAFSLVLASVALMPRAHAELPPTPAWEQGYNQDGRKSYLSTSHLTKAQAQRAIPLYEMLPTGGTKVALAGELAFAGGKVPVVAKAVATGATVFSVFKGLAGGPVGVGVAALMAAPAIMDWLSDGSARPAPPGSALPFERKDPAVCSVAPCNLWRVGGGNVNDTGVTKAAAAEKYCSSRGWGSAVYSSNLQGYMGPGWSCNFHNLTEAAFTTVSVPPSNAFWVPASIEDIRAEMEKTPSNRAVIDALLNAGGSLPIAYAPGGTTGPASVSTVPLVKSTPVPAPPVATSSSFSTGNPFGLAPGSATVTGSSTSFRDVVVDGKTVSVPVQKTTTSTYDPLTDRTTSTTTSHSDPHTVQTSKSTKTDLTYEPGKVTGTSSISTTTTVINNITNNVVNTSTDVENAPEKPQDDAATDTPFPELPVLYERKYPEGLTGIWSEKITSIKSTPIFSLVSGLMPTIATSGSCPSWPLALDFASWSSYGVHDVAPPCWVWDFGKVIIIISSLLLARALIFGG